MASGIYSHPGVLLEEHTNRVLAILRELLKGLRNDYWKEGVERSLLEMAVALHDFGKSTAFFQDVLQGRRRRDDLSRHAYLSSLFFLNRALEWLKAGNLPEEDYRLSLLTLHLIIKRHHTNLRDIYDEISTSEAEDNLNILQEQINSIDEDKANVFLQSLDLKPDQKRILVFSRDEFINWLKNDLTGVLRKWRGWWRKISKCSQYDDFGNFFAFLTAFSVLLDSDKLEAGAGGYLPERVDLPQEAVQRYKRKVFKNRDEGINALREQAFREVMEQELSADEHLYTLTLPTGMGKTLTGVAVALKLRGIIHREKGYSPRIIYSLPFLSIIDQNARVLEEVFRENLGTVDSRILIKHHHLSDLGYKSGEEELDYGVSRLLTEGWYSEVIITTFVQLFNTLLAWRNSTARRFNRLHGAILLIDEVQALPSVYWPLVRRLLMEAAERLNLYVILMTATQPYLLENAIELVPNPEKYFSALNRMNVHINLKPKTLEEFADNFTPEDGKSYLFVANTIASAQKLHNLLKSKLNEYIVFLSTEIPPHERLRRIREIKGKRYRFAVSTQLIEAGVDVDFDVVYRDFAPMDSLIQTAGRCNRNMSSEKRGRFNVVWWVDDKNSKFASKIYDPVLLDQTEKILRNRNHLSEKEFLSIVSEYFRNVWSAGINHGISEKFQKALCALQFDGNKDKKCILKQSDSKDNNVYISQFCLIKDEPMKKDVFIKITDEAKEVWEEFKCILKEMRKTSDIWKVREKFDRIKPRFYQYVVSTFVRLGDEILDKETGIFVIDNETLGRYYDPETGFIREENTVEIW